MTFLFCLLLLFLYIQVFVSLKTLPILHRGGLSFNSETLETNESLNTRMNQEQDKDIQFHLRLPKALQMLQMSINPISKVSSDHKALVLLMYTRKRK